MGIRIDGSTDQISAADGSLTIEGQSINTTGIITAASFFVGSATTTASQGVNVGLGASVVSDAVNEISVYTGSVERVNINSSGSIAAGISTFRVLAGSDPKIGVGTFTPGYTIEAFGSSNPTVSIVDTTNAVTTQVRSNSTGGLIRTASNHPLVLGTNQTERLRITSSGLVGINTATPEEQLHITHATAPGIQLQATSGGPYKSLIKMGGNDMEIRGSSGNMEFYTGSADGDSSTERVRIRTDGRVSIASSLAVAGVCTAAAFIPAQGQISNRNLIINGAMNVAQRGGGTMTAAGSYVPDRWRFWASGGSFSLSMGTLTSGAPYDLGFRKYVRIVNSSGASGATDYRIIRYVPEAQDMAKSGWDYTDANSDITLSFWVRSSIAFTPYAYFHTQDGTEKAYIFSLGSLSANTWTKVTKTIPGGTGVEFDNDTGAGMKIDFVQFWGTDYTGTVNTDQWVTYAGATRTPDMSNSWAVASGATFDITGVQLEVGSVATPFEQRSYGEELDRCMRYYEVIMPAASGNLYEFMGMWYSATEFTSTMVWTVPKRAAPTLVHNTGTNYFQAYGGSLSDQFDTWTGMQSASTRAGTIYNNNSITGGTTGHGGWCGSANDAAYIHVSAEL